jgi:4-amino-4-deoxy-L-arabinose transferase-like glycosyltransferase
MDKGFSPRTFLPEFTLFSIMALLLFINLGVFDLDPFSEFFHLESAKETLSLGRFWVPVLNGHDYVVRPPLWTWLTIIGFKLGGIGLSVARLPAALLSLAALGFTYLMTMELTKSRFSALFSTSLLAVSWGFFYLGALATADILTLNLNLIFLWAFLKWKDQASRRNNPVEEMNRSMLLMGSVLGLLVLNSGSLNVLLLMGVTALYLLLGQNTLLLNRMNFRSLLLPAVLIPLPWLLWVTLQPGQSGFILNYLLVYPLQKTLGLGLWANLKGDWLFYAKRLFLDLLPFWLLVPAAFLDPEANTGNTRHQSAPPTLWLLSWFLAGFTVYSLSAFQEPTLILPFIPPLAIIAGSYLAQVVEASHNKTHAYYERVLITYIMLLLIAAVLLTIVIFQVVPSNYVAGFWKLPGLAVLESLTLKDKVFPLPEAFPLWKFWLIPGPFILLIGAFTLFFLQFSRKLSLTPLALTSSLLIFMLFVKAVYLPIMHRPVNQYLAQQLNHSLKAGDRVLLFSRHPAVKRVMFYIAPQHRAAVRMVHSGQQVSQTLESGHGIIYGVIREKSYFNDLDYQYRMLFRVNHYNWQWDLGNLGEMGKLLGGRLPEFDKMRSEILMLQSLPADTLRVIQQEEQSRQTQSQTRKRK